MRYKERNEYSYEPECALLDILTDRGVTDLENFVNPTKVCELDPHDLDNIEAAATKLLEHLRADHNILFVVDADCDGYTSSSILWLYIKNIFPQAKLDFTVHDHKAHGLDDKIDWLEDEVHYDLVVAPDAASYDVDCHKRLMDVGTDVICLDHHEQLYDDNGEPVVSNFPNTIVVNNQLSPKYSNKSLCGAGVVYKFCQILDEILGINQAFNYIDLAALGEIADVMDRTNTETNYIMMEGLRNIKNKGFQTLIEAQSFSLKEKASFPYPGLTPIDVAFYIAPLINAVTRVGTLDDKETMFYCFIEPDKPLPSTKRGAKFGDIELAAEKTARIGNNAKSRQNKIKEKALDIIDFKIQKEGLDENNIIIVELDDGDGIPQEMTGLIAMAVVSKYHKPCMIGRRNDKNDLQGSIRSDGNFAGLPNFKEFLENTGYMNYVAGHDLAAGFSFNGNYYDRLISYANKTLDSHSFDKCYQVDYILDGKQDNSELLMALARHPEYFGNHIDEVTVVIENILLSSVQVMGAAKDSIKISSNGIDYVKFKDTDFIEKVQSDRTKLLTVYGRPNLNSWMGHESVQVFITDYELKEDAHRFDF